MFTGYVYTFTRVVGVSNPFTFSFSVTYGEVWAILLTLMFQYKIVLNHSYTPLALVVCSDLSYILPRR